MAEEIDYPFQRPGGIPSRACNRCHTYTWRRVNGHTVCGACTDKGADLLRRHEEAQRAWQEAFD